MNPEMQTVRDIFVAAVKLRPDQWEAFLKEACAGNDELRRQVSELLQEDLQTGNFLDQPAVPPPTTGQCELASEGAINAATQEIPGITIGRYKILELIGEGGMGAVWMAQQREPVERKVAFKIVKAGMDTRQVVARFEAERQALALMDHPNIAKVLDGGATPSGRPYFVMELVTGVPIHKYCDEHRLSPRERLELFLPVCQAIQHAHQKGIIHRDVKPSNVLVALYDGRPVPKVIDFGVAKATGQRLTERTLCTGFGTVVGTLEYMSPEQAELNNQDIDTRSDIYSLGVLLYELLTGTTPLSHERLKQAAFTEVLRIIREEEPPKPSARLSDSGDALPSISAQRQMEPMKLTKLVHGELDWIVMKALEKDRGRRYETANGFALDVQRYLADEPVEACPPTVSYRLRKFVRRNKAPMFAVGVVLAALVVTIIMMTWSNVRIQRALTARDEALIELQSQEQQTRLAEREKTLQLALARWNEARACRLTHRPGQRFQSLEALADAVRHLQSLDELTTRRLEFRNDAIASLSRWDVRCVRRVLPVAGHPQPWIARLDPLGQHYASADGPNVVSWRRLADDQVVHRWQWVGTPCNRLDISPNGRYVAAFCPDGRPIPESTCRVWDSVNGSLVSEHPHVTWDHDFRPDSKVLAVVQADGPIALYELDTGRNLPPLLVGPRPINLRFHPSGKYLAVSSREHQNVDVWDMAGREVAFRLTGERYRGGSLAWSPDGSLLAIGSNDSDIYVCAFPGGTVQAVLQGHSHVVAGVEYHPSGRLLASHSHDQTARLWPVSPDRELVIPGENVVGFSPDGCSLTTWSLEGLTQWELGDPGDCLKIMSCAPGPTFPIRDIAFASDGRLLACTSKDGVQLWDARAARLIGRVPSGDGCSLAFHPQDRSLFTTGSGGLMQWPVEPDRNGQTLLVGPGTVVRPANADSRMLRMKVAGTGDCLLLGAADGQLDLVSVGKACEVRHLDTHEGLLAVGLSADGRWAVSVGRPYYVRSNDDAVRIWDVGTGALVQRLPVDGLDRDFGAAFSPDSRWLVTSVGSELTVWEAGTWERKAQCPRARSLFGLLDFARDGGLLAVAQGRSRIELRDAVTLRHLATLDTWDTAAVTGLSLSPDGTQLAAATIDNKIALWDLRQLRQKLTTLGLDWELPPYPSAAQTAEPVEAITMKILSDLPSEAETLTPVAPKPAIDNQDGSLLERTSPPGQSTAETEQTSKEVSPQDSQDTTKTPAK